MARAASPYLESYTPPASPTVLHSSSQALTFDHFKRLWLDIVQAAQKTESAGSGVTKAGSTDRARVSQPPARASRLDFKVIDEIWNSNAYKYEIVQNVAQTDVDEFDEYVFVVRSRVDKKLLEAVFFIDVKSEPLRDALRIVLQDVGCVCLRGDKPSLERNILYNYLPELETYRSKVSNDQDDKSGALQHLDLLITYIKNSYAATSSRLVPLLEDGEITYDLFWALFTPTAVLYTTCAGTDKPRCASLDYGEERVAQDGTKYYSLMCRYFDFDGDALGDVSMEIIIDSFRGVRRISSLIAFPLRFHPDQHAMRARLITQGRKFVSLMGSYHCHCRGAAFTRNNKNEIKKLSVSSRIMVDAKFFKKMKPDYSRPHVSKTENTTSGRLELWSQYSFGSIENWSDQHPSGSIKRTDVELAAMKEDDLLVCCPTVPGFSLNEKIWGEFAVADIEDIEWSLDVFECLTIPEEDKEALMALAESRRPKASTARFDDFIAGKGQGLNVLLHGSPGLGKTLTAEAVAEHLRRPLYSISAGELPSCAGDLEVQLSRIFEIAAHWGAILLLDEADVFLERRSTQDLVRNGLVSVFLRKLEYCQAIMFMTTNRASQFDEAVLSRIHLMLRYERLGLDAKKEIWANFLKRAATPKGKVSLSKEHFGKLVSTNLNGREIKNVVAIAHALAMKGNAVVSFAYLQKAVKANESFWREFTNADHIGSIFL